MTPTDIILLTFASTVTLIVIGVIAYRVIRAVRKYARELLSAVKEAARVVTLVNGELAYMRQLSQGMVVQQAPQETTPPVGRRAPMPDFPQRDWNAYQDATAADTDKDLLNQTDQEVMEAQAREEMRASGVEPDEDGLPQEAVREEA